MDRIEFEKLLLKTAFCCLASDGNIDKREIDLIKVVFSEYEQYQGVNFDEKINSFIKIYNEKGKDFFTFYFDILKEESFTFEEELEIIDIAIRTIQADELVEYSEIKFFKIIRHNLKSTDEQILKKFPDIELFLEEDIVTESLVDKITKQYFESVDFPQFEVVQLDNLDEDAQ
jgi:hypothetical protein